jgi:hypothetical protein
MEVDSQGKPKGAPRKFQCDERGLLIDVEAAGDE